MTGRIVLKGVKKAFVEAYPKIAMEVERSGSEHGHRRPPAMAISNPFASFNGVGRGD